MSEAKAVYASIAKILGEMSVAKGGVLPGNMGGKPYITAVDLNEEVKRKFVENGLIIVPNEKVIKHENIVSQRTTISIVIEGTYEIISIEDGSSVTISGVGDGLAIGTAVASNIASTNALKNALLRFLLVTEQSVEDAAKDGVPDEPAAKTEKASKETVDSLTAEIGSIIRDENNSFDGAKVNDLGDKLTGSTPKKREWTLTDLKKIRNELVALVEAEAKTGEVAEV